MAMDIPKDHKAALSHHFETERVRYFQEKRSHYLAVDGIYGPQTAAALDTYIAKEFPGAPVSPSIAKALESALLDVGQHEVPMGSNNGPYVEALRYEIGLPRLGGGEWCAVFVSVHCTRAGIPIASRGAPGIVRAMIALPGGREVKISDIKPGFVGLALRKRGATTHHVQMFRAYHEDGRGVRIQHVGGNEKHKVDTRHWVPSEFFEGVIQVATYG